MKKKKRFTEAEIELLRQSPYVKHVRPNRLTLTFEFRMILWESWVKEPYISTLKQVYMDHGLNVQMIGSQQIGHLQHNFKTHGKPSGGTNKIFKKNEYVHNTSKKDRDYLISTGKFIIRGRGITFHPNFINEIYRDYPQISIEQKLKEYDIDPIIVGYRRIHDLKRKLDDQKSLNLSSYHDTRVHYDDPIIKSLEDHPYIGSISPHQISFNDHFYHEAYPFRSLDMDEILAIFEMDSALLSVSKIANLKYKLRHWNDRQPSIPLDPSPLIIKINNNKINKLMEMIDDQFQIARDSMKDMDCFSKKKLCQWISSLPDDKHDFTIRKILKKIGISPSNYYHILNNPHYGMRDLKDDKDIQIIRKVLESEPKYPMGTRMVYMKMKEITGQQFCLKKVRRLMKKYNLLSSVRKSNHSRQASKKLVEENKKPNILKRQFRLNKPLKVCLSDVSYLKYGHDKTAYLSTVKDSVSGKILACVLSETNDARLADDTINQLVQNMAVNGTLFHTDQGSLYLNGEFQFKIKNLGFIQSMSRRGNCWDNASQESFFGHLKDECDYSWCTNIDEISHEIEAYVAYYNDRRPQWNRHKMTPTQYEQYLLNMDEEDFDQYLRTERKKYDKMIKEAAEKAKKRAKEIYIM